MGIILNGVAVGFLSAIFISLYAEGFFNALLPIWLIYGIFAPLMSAIVITIGMLARKKPDDMEWWEKEEK